MIDLNQAPKYFAVLHTETGSHDETIRRIAAHYYQRGLEDARNMSAATADSGGGVLEQTDWRNYSRNLEHRRHGTGGEGVA